MSIDLTAFKGKRNGIDTLSAESWNTLMQSLETAINENSGSSSSSEVSNFYVNGVLTNPVNGVITLANSASYVLEGTLYGQVVVDAMTQPTDNTFLTLRGVKIITSATAGIRYSTPVDNTGFKDLIINIEKDTTNIIYCTTVVARADFQEACIYSMNNLVVQGVGYLSLMNKGGHGIKATELRTTGLNLYIEASHDGIHGNTLLNLDEGFYYINKANDAFGTGETGVINIHGGTYYAYNIDGNVFDGKMGTHIFDIKHKISGTSVDQASRYVGYKDINVASTAMEYFGTASITMFDTDPKLETGFADVATGTPAVKDANGVYQITKNFVLISGYIDAPINVASTISDVLMYLNGCCVISTIVDAAKLIGPTIYYQSKSSKLKLYSVKDTHNVIYNNVTSTTDPKLVDIDAVKSENNISIEVKSNSYLGVISQYADGLDGSDVKITDSSGVFYAKYCGGRGIKGTTVDIGPNVEAVSGVFTYYTDPADTLNYSTMDGAVICVDNCQHATVGIGYTNTDPTYGETYKDYGYADVFARSGKYTSGAFGTQNKELRGVFICGSIAAVVGLNFDKANNIFYKTIVTGAVTNGCGKTFNSYGCIPFNKAPIPKD